MEAILRILEGTDPTLFAYSHLYLAEIDHTSGAKQTSPLLVARQVLAETSREAVKECQISAGSTWSFKDLRHFVTHY